MLLLISHSTLVASNRRRRLPCALLCTQANLSGLATFVQGIQAGAYIAFGAFLACTVAGTIPGVAAANPGLAKLLFALVFPVGLALVTNCGAELYTGNTMMLTVAMLEKKATFGQLVKNWVVSYAGEHRRTWAAAAHPPPPRTCAHSHLESASAPWHTAFSTVLPPPPPRCTHSPLHSNPAPFFLLPAP